MNRKQFLTAGLVSTVGLTFSPVRAFSDNQKFSADPLDRELVFEFVKVAHGDMNKVQQMLEKTPKLLHASHDWGDGDYESALEAASHIGHRPLVEFLLGKGARINLFTSAMLGDLTVIKQVLTVYPKLIDAKGPHGLDLKHHARVGGEASKKVLDYLEEFTIEEEQADLPQRNDLATAKTKYEKRAVELVDHIHTPMVTDSEFLDSYVDPSLIEEKGLAFFEGLFKRFEDIPPANVVLLEGSTHELCKMQLQKTDQSTNYYFKLTYSKKSPHMLTNIVAAGRNIF
ncbi:MAG: hypothetical protein ABJP45_02045 [Cyclobacteriaceae bacterium]